MGSLHPEEVRDLLGNGVDGVLEDLSFSACHRRPVKGRPAA